MSRLTGPGSVRFPLYTASGSARELGRQHGEQARPRILGLLAWLCECLRLKEEVLEARAARFRPLFEQRCPQLLDEIHGLAEGTGLSQNLALACQLRGELGAQPAEGCTTFVLGGSATADGRLLIGQTSDMPSEMREFAYVLHLTPDDRPEVIMWTFGGMIGYHGLNSRGVAHFANSVGGGPAWKFALSHYPLKRLILEQTNLPAVRSLMSRFPVCSNGNYVLSDGEGRILDCELTSAGPHFIEPGDEGFLAHSNHYVCSPLACQENFDQSLPDSFPRLERISHLIRSRLGSITLPDMQQILSDHDGHPVGICRHPHDGPDDPVLPTSGRTVAALIAEPERGRLHIAAGNPCEYPFIEFRLSTAT